MDTDKYTSIIPHNVAVYGKNCVGAKTHSRDVMITFLTEKVDFVDTFLTTEQAEALHKELGLVLERNKSSAV